MEGVESFLAHLETIQRAAQLTTGPDATVEDMVAEVYRRALAARRAGDARPPRILLIAMLRDVQREAGPAAAETVAERVASASRASEAADHARAAVSDVLSGLDSPTWSLLVLSEVDGVPVDELTELTGIPPEETVARLQELLSRIHDRLFAEVGPAGRVSLLESLPEDWLKVTLSSILRALPEVSGELRARIASAAGPQPRTDRVETHRSQITRPEGPRPVNRRDRRFRPMSVLVGIALILVVGFGADYLYSTLSREPERDLIELAARDADRFRPDLPTASATRAERFLHTHSGLQVRIPKIDGATLNGVGMEEVAPDVHAPAIRFIDDESGADITVYAISYRFLDSNPSVVLSSDVRRQIQSEANFDLHNLGAADVLVWRHRSGIYLAVTELDGREIRARIGPPARVD